MKTFHRKYNFILVVAAVFFIFGLTQAAFAQCPDDGSEPFTTGPVNPNNGFATYVEDSGSVLPGGPLALEICLDGDGVTGPCIYDAVDPGNPYSVQVGFGAEAFWYLANAVIDNATTVPAGGFSAEVVMAVEAAWAAEVPGEGDQFPFTRLRIRLDVPAVGSYTVIHPYGQITYLVNALVAGRDVNDPIDIPFAPNATNQKGRILPYLIWDPAVGDPAPAGYIGDPQVLHEVVGSPCGTNEFTVIPPAGVDIGGGPGQPVTETLFSVQGKISTLFGVSVERATYSRFPAGNGRIDVFASSQTLQSIDITGIGNKTVTMVEDPPVSGKYFAHISYGPNNFTIPGGIITATNRNDGLFVEVPVVDFVRIPLARYDTDPGDPFQIRAISSDKNVGPVPILEAFDENGNSLGTFPSDSILIVTPKPLTPPNRITVRSPGFGGEATESVEIVGGTTIP